MLTDDDYFLTTIPLLEKQEKHVVTVTSLDKKITTAHT